MRFLGDIDLAIDGEPLVDLKSKKAAALLCYLATTGATHDRLALATLLWSDTPEANARTSLRKVVSAMRKTLAPYLIITNETLAFNQNSSHWIDAQKLEQAAQLLRRTANDGDICSQLQEAADLYRGDFLSGFYVRNAPLFEEWVLTQQARLRELVLGILPELASRYADRNQMTQAIGTARRLLQLEPWREDGHRQLMAFLAQDGRRSEALAQFEICRQMMMQEFDAEPGPDTVALFEEIRDKRFEPPSSGQQREWPEKPISLGRPPPSPYRGLFAFREQDAPFFFGREAISERLVTLTRRQPLVAIVGPSGSGKSSLALAGLVAALRPDHSWQSVVFRPGSQPLSALAVALVPLLEPVLGETDQLVQAGKMAAALQAEVLSLGSVIDRINHKLHPVGRLLLLVDQFEELYTLSTDERERNAFLGHLLNAMDEQRLRSTPTACIGLTLRADFLERALANRRLADALQDSTLILGPMDRDELARAIERPAEVHGVAFEAGLVSRIMDDVGSGSGNLPLLEFALTKLWEEQDGWSLTHVAYEAIGQVEGALARYADEVYAQLSEADQVAARRIFTQLVRPGSRTEDTRRQAARTEIGDGDWLIVQRLADARLLVTGRDPAGQETAELAHEALMLAWDRLRNWLAEDRAFRLWQERLRATLGAWQASDADEGALLRGRLLVEAEDWSSEYGDRLSQVELDFIAESQALRDKKARSREQARLAQERVRRRIIFGLATLLLISLAALGSAIAQGRRAQAQARLAFARELTAAAFNNLKADPELSILLAIEALHTTLDADSTVVPEAEQALHQAVQSSRLLYALPQGGGLAFDPDGARLATGGEDGVVHIANALTGETLMTFDGLEEAVTGVAFSPDGALLAGVTERRQVLVWDLASGRNVLELPGTDDTTPILGLTKVDFSPDGELLLLAGPAADTSIWEVATGQKRVQIVNSGVADATFSPDGGKVALTTAVWAIPAEFQVGQDPPANSTENPHVLTWEDRLFDFADAIVGIQDPSSNISAYQDAGSVVYSPDGDYLLTSVISTLAVMVNASDGEQQVALLEHAGIIHSMDIAPNGEWVATASADGTARVWHAQSGELLFTFEGHQGEVVDVAFHPEGSQLATSSLDGRTRVWDIADVDRGEWLNRYEFQGNTLVAFDPQLPNLIVADEEGSVAAIDVMTGVLAYQTRIRDRQITSLALSQDSATIALGYDGGGFAELDAPTGELLRFIETGETISALAFTPDDDLLVAGSEDGTITFYGRGGEAPLISWQVHERFVNGLVFDPDGDHLASADADGVGYILQVEKLLPIQNEGQGTTGPLGLPPGAKSATLAEHNELILNLRPSPDGDQLLTASWDGTAVVWDAVTGASVLTLSGHRGQVVDATYSPDGNRIATAGSDGQVILWDARSGEQLFVLASLQTPLRTLDYSHDGTFLAVSSTAGSVHVFVVPVEDLMELARIRVARSLTESECMRYLHLESCPPDR